MNQIATDSIHENALLRRLVKCGDAEAFSQMNRLYAGMVYGTCLRITGDAHHAADAAQETFFHLLKHADRIKGSLGSWLHQVATRRAIDLIRRDVTRRQREKVFAAQTLVDRDHWADVSPLVDEALEELDAVQRNVLVRHYLQGQSMVQMATVLGVSQPTISRRIGEALEELRARLRAKGVMVTVAILSAVLPSATTTAPAAVVAELGKMALTVSGATTHTSITTALSSTKVAVAAIVFAAGLAGLVAYHNKRPPSPVRGATGLGVPVSTEAPIGAGRSPTLAPASSVLAIKNSASEFAPVTSSQLPMPDVSASTAAAPPAAMDSGVPRFRMGTAPSPATPAGAVHRLASALARGDRTGLQKCFVPGTTAYEGLRRILEFPQSAEEQEIKQCLESLSTPVEVLETTATDDGLKVRWQATVRKPFTTFEDGIPQSWQIGHHFELEARLKQVEGEWKIINF